MVAVAELGPLSELSVYCPVNKNKLCSVYIWRIYFGLCHLNYSLHWTGLAISHWQWQYLDIYSWWNVTCMCKSKRVSQSVPCIPALSWMLIHSGIAHMLQKKLYKSLSTWTYIFLMNVQVNWHHIWRFCSLWIKHVYMLHVGVMVIFPYTTLLAYLYFTHKPKQCKVMSLKFSIKL